MADALIHLDLHARPDGPLVVLGGDIDLAVRDRVVATIADAQRHATGTVFLDLGAVTFIDSSGMTAMLLSAQRLGDEGKDLRIVAASSTVARTIDLAGLQEVLPMQGD